MQGRALVRILVGMDSCSIDLSNPFRVFDAQDSGCVSYGIEHEGERWFVKVAQTEAAAAALRRVASLHAAVEHDAIVGLEAVLDGPMLVYPWREGVVLNHATVHGVDRSGLERFQSLPVAEVVDAVDAILDAHRAIADAGWIAVDLYDGCFLYDFERRTMQLIDLDEYRPGPFVLEDERLPGSRRYMAPEEFQRGARIDQRTNVLTLGRVVWHLLDAPTGWRGSERVRAVVGRATHADPGDRYADVRALVDAWRASLIAIAG